MRIYRSAPKRSFTTLPNATARDKRLSWTAAGILTYLLGLPDGSRTSVRQLAAQRAEGRDRVAAALRQLEEARYLRRVKSRGATGRLTTHYEVFDMPYVAESGEPYVPEPVGARETMSGNPDAGEPSVGGPGHPHTGTKTGATRPPTLGDPSPERDGGDDGERLAKRRRTKRDETAEQGRRVSGASRGGTGGKARAEAAAPAPAPSAVKVPGPRKPDEGCRTAPAPEAPAAPPEAPEAPEIVWDGSEAVEGAAPPPDPADAPQRPRREEPLTGSAELLSRLGRRDRRLTLGAEEARRLAPLLDEWFAVGADEASVLHALTSGLPARVHAAAALVADRLRRKKPAPRAPKPRPVARPTCTNCNAIMFQPGLCNACHRELALYGDLPPDPTDYSVTPETAITGAAAVRAAFHINGPARGSQLRGVPLPGSTVYEEAVRAPGWAGPGA
ncbi:hypothetical protein [Streptomyces sp. NPDC058374]|uniref:hypothetical protein n=1 Tax=Streptomyces sp. NPDC058374 TaxID=3346466 RepID=UPI00365684E3